MKNDNLHQHFAQNVKVKSQTYIHVRAEVKINQIWVKFGNMLLTKVSISPLHAIGLFLCPLKTPENQRSSIFRGYMKTSMARDGLTLAQAMQKGFTAAYISFQLPSRHLLVQNYNGKTKILSKICLKSTIKTPDWRYRSGVAIVNFQHISHNVPLFALLNLNKSWLATIFKLFRQLSDTSFKLKFYLKAIFWVL